MAHQGQSSKSLAIMKGLESQRRRWVHFSATYLLNNEPQIERLLEADSKHS